VVTKIELKVYAAHFLITPDVQIGALGFEFFEGRRFRDFYLRNDDRFRNRGFSDRCRSFFFACGTAASSLGASSFA